MVGLVEGTQIVTIKGVQRLAPYLVARCVHVWKTGRYAISDFPNLPGGYYPLEQQTYCLTIGSLTWPYRSALNRPFALRRWLRVHLANMLTSVSVQPIPRSRSL